MLRCIHAIVTGRVQGVFFRDSTQKKANTLNIQGWVRNNSDGTVELIAKGEKVNMDTFTRWLEHGPAAARVDDLVMTDKPVDAYHFDSFDVTG